MKLDAVAAYSAQPELNKPATATQTAQSPAVAKNFEEDVVNLSGVSAGSEQPSLNGNGKHPPEATLEVQLNGSGWHPPEIAFKAQSNGTNLELPQPDHNGFGKHPPE